MFRFTKSRGLQKKWILKFRRGDYMNPSLTSICYKHFGKDAYPQDLKAELLGNYYFDSLFLF